MIDHIFVHIPGTAGTSVRAAIGSRRIVHDLARNHYQRPGVEWDRYFKYSIIRNPFDRAVSICAKLKGCAMGNWLTPEVFRRTVAHDVANGKTVEGAMNALCLEHNKRPHGRWLSPEVFRAWVAEGMPDTRIHNGVDTARMCTPQREYLTAQHSEWLVDHIVRFEHLAEDIPVLCDLLGIPQCAVENKNPSARELDYRTYYDNESRARVEDRFAVDFEEWQHQF